MWYPLYDISVPWMDHCQVCGVGGGGGYCPYAYGIVCNFVQSFANSQIFISETTDKKSFTYHGHQFFLLKQVLHTINVP